MVHRQRAHQPAQLLTRMCHRLPSRAIPDLKSLLMGGLLLLVSFAGCREKAPPQALTWEAVPATLNTAFQGAPAGVRDQVQAALSALQSNDVVAASIQLETLCGQPGLTERQREEATRCWLAAKERLRTAAAAGDPSASEVIQLRRGVK
jgi:hypothetical protein